MKSFGLIEAIAASTIIIIIVSGTVSLSAYSMRAVANDSSYFEAENIADSLFEKILQKKSSGSAVFFSGENPSPDAFLIDCFDSETALINNCLISGNSKTGIDFTKSLGNGYFNYIFDPISPLYSNDFFSFKIKIVKPISPNETGYSSIYNDNFTECKSVNGAKVPLEKCRMAHIEIKWSDQGREKKYFASQYLTDWER